MASFELHTRFLDIVHPSAFSDFERVLLTGFTVGTPIESPTVLRGAGRQNANPTDESNVKAQQD
ncbi:hypothetical protein ACVWZZ_003249 [Bradyrhizobium sp. LM6.10]|jgi:hypothetical protein